MGGPADYNFPSAEVLADPYDFYRALAAHPPVYKLPQKSDYLVSNYDDVAWCLRHPELLSSRREFAAEEDSKLREIAASQRHPRSPAIADTDPPVHTKNRALTFRVFTPARLRRYEQVISQLADELIDSFIDRGSVEWVSEYARRLPMYVICALIGLDRRHGPQIRQWSDDFVEVVARFATGERAIELQHSLADFYNFLSDEVERRQRVPSDDVLSEIVNGAYEDGARPDVTTLVNIARNLAVGGHETTTSLLANTMYLLLTHREVLDEISSDRTVIPRVIEEAMRIESPVQWVSRMATSDFELGAATIPKGSRVLLLCGAANRDESKFDAADQMDIHRANVKDHLGFGLGIHFCLGAPLARLEVRITLDRILARLRNLRLADSGRVEVTGAAMVRYVNHLKVDFDKP
jgi:cytochrome P450